MSMNPACPREIGSKADIPSNSARNARSLYYSMELADDHLAGREIDIVSYEPRTFKERSGPPETVVGR